MCVTMPRLNISMIWYTHEVKVFVAPIGPVIGTETAFYQINFFFFPFFLSHLLQSLKLASRPVLSKGIYKA